jgi:hypothetical protein
MSKYPGRILRATAPTVTVDAAPGIWTVDEALQYKQAGTWPQQITEDPFFNQTTLLLHGDGTNGAQNNTFLDSSTNTFTITRNGNTTQGTFSPLSNADGQWSNYFDSATPRYITAPNLAPGTNNFSIECWYYATALPQQFTALAGQDNSAANGTWTWRVNSNDNYQLTFVYYNGGFVEINSSATYNPNNGGWYHCLVTRDGTDLRMFMDGVLAAHGTLPGSFNFSGNSATLFIGRAERDSGNINGYISNFRYVRGSIPTAYQTASTTPGTTVFTPPTNSLTAITDTILLTCQSNRFVDNSASPQTITSVSSSVQPFNPFAPSAAYSPSVNGGSGYFDGGNNYLTFTKNTTSGAFTCECWFYRGANVTQHNIFTGSNITVVGADNIQFVVTNTGGIGLTMNGVVISATGTAVTRDAWSHLVWVRDASNNVATFVNGNRISTATTSAPLNVVSIGAYFANHSPNGYVADARIVNEAVYDPTLTTLTVPTTPLTAVSNTYLLANFTNAGIFDNTGKNNLETVGNAQIDTSVKKYGTGSIKFDGTGDYLYGSGNINTQMGTGAFTWECWCYITTTAAYQGFIDTRPVPTNGSSTGMGFILSTGTLTPIAATTGTILTSSINVTLNAWTHVALTRTSGGTLTIWVNGVSGGSVSNSSNLTDNALFVGGNSSSPHSSFVNGYIDDLRITKGVARYTTTFTPPTKAFADQ